MLGVLLGYMLLKLYSLVDPLSFICRIDLDWIQKCWSTICHIGGKCSSFLVLVYSLCSHSCTVSVLKPILVSNSGDLWMQAPRWIGVWFESWLGGNNQTEFPWVPAIYTWRRIKGKDGPGEQGRGRNGEKVKGAGSSLGEARESAVWPSASCF